MKRLVTMLLLALCLTAQEFISESSFTPIIYQGSSQSVGLSTSGSNVSGSIGAGKNSSSEDSQWVNNTTTFICGGEMNVTADKTTVTGAVLANASRDKNGNLQDHGNMNLVTDELIINDLQDYNKSSNKGFNANVSAGWAEGSGNQKGHLTGTSTVGVQKGGHNTEHNLAGQPSWNAEGSPKGQLQDVGDQTTYATLGGGAVTKKSGEKHDLTNTNRDINNTQ